MSDVAIRGAYHKSDRQGSRALHCSDTRDLFAWYDGSMAERTELVVATKPFIKTLSMKCMRALQASYLCIVVEIVETDGTMIMSV
jgi:hypothetical protein